MKPRRQSRALHPYLPGALIVLLVLAAYFPALRGQFLWDDDVNVTQNLPLRSLNGLEQIWFKPGATQQYYPLTHTSFWLDYHLWGTNPLPYHAENILLHAFSAILLWRILKRLAVPGAWFGAALFAVHPICVESVAWITERKNVLCGIFSLGAILMSLRFWPPIPPPSILKKKPRAEVAPVSDHGPWKFYWLAMVLYLCALWSKTAGVGLPVVMALLLWWKRSRIGKWEVGLLTPFLAAGMAISLITIEIEAKLGAAQSQFQYSLIERCLIANRAVWFYLGKLVWPHPLILMYPRWEVSALELRSYIPVMMLGVMVLILWMKRNTWGRPVLFALGCFLALLFPVMGFFNVAYFSYSFVADHFQYLACISPLVLAAGGLTLGVDRLKRRKLLNEKALICVMLLALMALTWKQTGIYRNLEVLWRDVVVRSPGSWGGHCNLGLVLFGQGRIDEAIEQYKEALQLNSQYTAIHDNLGNALASQGKLDEAVQQYSEALQIAPSYANAHNNLGNILVRKGDLDGAIRQYTQALQTSPDFADAHYNLGNALVRKGSLDEAEAQYDKVLQIRPDYAGAHNKLGYIFSRKGKLDEAIQHYRQALGLDPGLIYVRYNLGSLLAAKGETDAAMEQYAKILETKPDFAEAQSGLADALAAKGRLDEAIEHYHKALQIDPAQSEVFYNLGMTLVKQGKPDEARIQFAQALRLRPSYNEAERQLQMLSSPENNVGPGK